MIDFSVFDIWLAMHLAGVVIAVGAVTVTDGFMAFFHLHSKFGKIVKKVAPLLSMIVWIGFLLISVSGLYFIFDGRLDISNIFVWFKMVLVGVVFLNGIVLNKFITPKFQELSVKELESMPMKFEIMAGLSGGISVIGWWSILFLAYFFI